MKYWSLENPIGKSDWSRVFKKQTNKQTEFSRVWGYVTGNQELQQKLLFKTVPIIEMDETHETLLLDFFSPEHGQK